MRADVLDRACASLWVEIRALLGRHRRLADSMDSDTERRIVLARIDELRALSARYREVQRREGWAARGLL